MSGGKRPPPVVAKGARAPAAQPRHHVLVVDNEERNRKILQTAPEDRGFVVSTYPDGSSMLAALHGGLDAHLLPSPN
jgi:CheY-like chemotaxis protein